MNELSAAHKTLPLPSVVEVTNLQNGRALRLRVNDRGPFVDGRIIDLSRRAAQLLGFETVGTARVRVRILKEESIQVAEAAMHGEIGNVMLAHRPPRPHDRSGTADRAAADRVGALRRTPPRYGRPRSSGRRQLPRRQPEAAWRQCGPPPLPRIITGRRLSLRRMPRPLHPAMAPAPPPSRIFVQAGTFAVPENAQRVRARIAALGSVEVVPTTGDGAALYRVRAWTGGERGGSGALAEQGCRQRLSGSARRHRVSRGAIERTSQPEVRAVMRLRWFSSVAGIVVLALAGLLALPGPFPAAAAKTKHAAHPKAAPTKAAPAKAAPAPNEPTVGPIDTLATHALIVEAETGAVLLDKGADERIPTASLSKVMTAYVVFDLLKQGRAKLTDELPVSEAAWRTQGSKMLRAARRAYQD